MYFVALAGAIAVTGGLLWGLFVAVRVLAGITAELDKLNGRVQALGDAVAGAVGGLVEALSSGSEEVSNDELTTKIEGFERSLATVKATWNDFLVQYNLTAKRIAGSKGGRPRERVEPELEEPEDDADYEVDAPGGRGQAVQPVHAGLAGAGGAARQAVPQWPTAPPIAKLPRLPK